MLLAAKPENSCGPTQELNNKVAYQKTKIREWSNTIRERGLLWYGHLLSLTEDTPGKAAFSEAHRCASKPRGDQKLMWLGLVEHE